MFRGTPRRCSPNFTSFGTPRKLIFRDFEASGLPDGSFSQKNNSSGHPETLFFWISTFRDAPKHNFSHFSLVACKRNAVFGNFWWKTTSDGLFFIAFRSSLASETLFLAIFDEKTRATDCFLCFSRFVDRRWAFSAVLYKFPVSEMQKILKTARREKNRTPKVISSNFRGSVHILIRTCSFIIL